MCPLELIPPSYSRHCKLPRYQDANWCCNRWNVLARPWWRKLLQCFPCLLWYDVIQWRMDHVLHHWWIRGTQKWSDVQSWFPLWSRRVQNKLQQYFCKLNIPQTKMTPSTKRLQLKSSPFLLDLLQVDLLASGASLFWPRSDLPRATKSYEIRRRTFLKVFLFVYSSIFKLHPYRPRFYAAQSGVRFNEALVKVVTHRLAVVISLQLETMGSIFPTIWRDAVLVAFVCLFVSLQLETTVAIRTNYFLLFETIQQNWQRNIENDQRKPCHTG